MRSRAFHRLACASRPDAHAFGAARFSGFWAARFSGFGAARFSGAASGAPASLSAAASACSEDDEVEEVAPPRPSMRADPLSSSMRNDDDEVECVGVSGSNALVDMPHLREHCLLHPFGDKKRAIERCAKCYCYVCDMLASTCPQWRSHCRAHSSKKPWQAKKLALKNHKAALAAAEQDHGAAATRTPKPPTPTARTRPGTRPSFSLSSSDLALSQPNIFNMPNYLPNHPPALARPPDLSYFHQPPTPAIPTPQSYLVATPQSAAPSARQRHARAQAHAPASSPLSDGLPRVRVSLPRVRARDGLPPLPPPVDARPSSAAEEQRLYAVTHRALIESGLRADYSSSTNAPPHGFSM